MTPDEHKVLTAAREIRRRVARETVEATPRKPVGALWRVMIKDHQGWRCARCPTSFVTGEPVQYDHILPLELGGEHVVHNLQALCVPCHKAKTREDIKRIRKAQRLERDSNPETRRRSPRPLRSRGFRKADELKP